MLDLNKARGAVISVGGGRGFVIEGPDDRLIITAAHCLPAMPPAIPSSYTEERTYEGLLSPLGAAERPVWAECLFVDPVSDLAILGPPDGQELPEPFDAYLSLVDSCHTVEVGTCDPEDDVWLLSLDGEWHPCGAKHVGGGVWFHGADHGIHGGMSGSPAINRDGQAVAVVSVSSSADHHTSGGPNPNLAVHLPGWAIQLVA
ncbi:trypsin-like peptidase domain-containing protein [Bradyrhizobium sp. 6(2017)]|uniref:trypsin-like peptidase domain-containing protein n=1 Tax=Bradyrhizobium sp. 6(2017) TaxID=1197460 RepID=UPI0013E1DA36|nr:trypsin-like peptidase domain-containing protein [Bradyrhizobium sp. 6(2017)]QIG93465.1 trypsin-like peptidase domain-containing protein [Bradyrhizobium sp. 6(2017)]